MAVSTRAVPEEEGKEHETAQGEPHAVEPERADVLHADALGHEGETPDDGGEKKQAVGPQRLIALIDPRHESGNPMVGCRHAGKAAARSNAVSRSGVGMPSRVQPRRS